MLTMFRIEPYLHFAASCCLVLHLHGHAAARDPVLRGWRSGVLHARVADGAGEGQELVRGGRGLRRGDRRCGGFGLPVQGPEALGLLAGHRGSWASPATPGPATFGVCTSLHEFLSEKGQRWEAVMEAGATNGFGRIGRLIVRTGRATFSMSVDSHLYWRG